MENIILMLKEFDYDKNSVDDLEYFLQFCLKEIKKWKSYTKN